MWNLENLIAVGPYVSNSHLKIRRARSFIEELKALLFEYGEGANYRAYINDKSPQPHLVVEWNAIDPMAGLIIGDAIHNLRSALDIMANDLAVLTSNSDRVCSFPFPSDRQNISKEIKAKKFDLCGDDACQKLRAIKPYKGGNEKLYALHQFDIQDKHKTILLYNASRTIEVSGSYSVDGSTDAVVTKLKMNVDARFPDGSVFENLNVVETLHQLADMVESIVADFGRMVAVREPRS